jgi:hypothetical protein
MSERYIGTLGFRVENCASDEEMEANLDSVMEQLYDDERIIDPDYTASLDKRFVEFALTIESDADFDEASVVLTSALRTAMHAAGCGTPNWENHFKQMAQQISVADREFATA